MQQYAVGLIGYGLGGAIFHAPMIAATPGPRYVAHGTRGSFIKDGVDTREDGLKQGARPGDGGVYEALYEGKPVPVAAGDAVAVVRVIECAYRSHQERRTIDFA